MAAILLVDDDDSLRFLVGELLQLVGHDCTQAGSVSQARAWLRVKRFEMIISDFNMPRESGLDLLRHVLSEYPGMLFIMVTGESSPEIRRKALNMGIYDYIVKPFRLSGLLMSVSKALSENCQRDPMSIIRTPCTFTSAAAH